MNQSRIGYAGPGILGADGRMTIEEMRAAVEAAEAEIRRANVVATEMARVLVGRLRHVRSPWVLEKLKRELRDFNMQTGTWMR